MNDITAKFFQAYWQPGMMEVYTEDVSAAMMAGPVNEDGWFEWKLAEGTLLDAEYERLAKAHGVLLPPSFIDWHKAFFFCDGDCFIARLPPSLPNEPLRHLAAELKTGEYLDLTTQGLYTFAQANNDAGPLVFDARQPVENNEFPIREYEHDAGNYSGDLAGLSEVIFSSFSKMLECLTFFLNRPKAMDQTEAVRAFFTIDPTGAGGPGREYWLSQFVEH
ncbi:hypothetical protein DNI29_11770 [Hymenobacter sediminis]|uniref:hypothetical protein n=1 Tax=Hymenobacter sediminis TaxID=2218621 RepID=UPI000DA6988E|nr:hypothetical protein [Hymenobacter sediminis]RPD46832.1 hypothetical protein DNI29_11770 [Hymenobacter sediminis]